MKKLLRVSIRSLPAVLVVLLLTSCEPKFEWPWLKEGSKTSASVSGPSGEIAVGPFDSIRQDGMGALVLDSTLPEGVVKITASDKDRESMIAEINGSTLVLRTKEGSHMSSGQAEYRVNPGKTLSSLILKGMGEISSAQPWVGKDILVQIEGMGKITFDVQATAVTVRQQGAGQVLISGTADSLEVDASGLGQVDAVNLVARTVRVKSSGVGEVLVNATEDLDIHSSGLGAVNYKGNPKTKNLKSTGATSIEEITD